MRSAICTLFILITLTCCLCAPFVAATDSAISADLSMEQIKQHIQNFFLPSATTCGLEGTDLAPYKGKVIEDAASNAGSVYKMTLCDKSKESNCAADGGSFCQYQTDGSYVNYLASWTSNPPPDYTYINQTDHSAGVQISFENGGICSAYNDLWALDLTVMCGNTDSLTFSAAYTCYGIGTLTLKALCPGHGGKPGTGLSTGALFLIVVFALLAIYFAVGCVVCAVKFGQPWGLQALPHREFWLSIPAWFLAGLHFTIGKIKGLFGSTTITSTQGEYEEV